MFSGSGNIESGASVQVVGAKCKPGLIRSNPGIVTSGNMKQTTGKSL